MMASSPPADMSPVPSIHVEPPQETDWGEGLLKQFEDLSSKLKEDTDSAAGTDTETPVAGQECTPNRTNTSTPDPQPPSSSPKSSPPLSQIFEGGDYTSHRSSPRKTS
ncbi:hypothetical protein HK097_007559, partial [Rhizophlyctis rosea]